METDAQSKETPAILVVGPSWVGDMVMAQSLFKVLKLRDPAPRIHVLAPAWTRPLLERMPEVDDSMEMPMGHGTLDLGKRRTLGRRLARRGYEQAILLPNSWKSALIPWWAGIPRRTGWLGEMRYGLLNDVRKLDKQALPLTVQRFTALAREPGDNAELRLPRPRLEIKAFAVQAALQQQGVKKRAMHPVLALCPGAEYGPSKQWPPAYFGHLARLMHERGWDVWLFGSNNDRKACADVNGFSRGVCTDLAGRTSLAQAVDLLSLADHVVTNDSGMMHIAAALNHPVTALFGSTDPTHTPPLSDRAKTLYLALDCSPCFRRQCPLGHRDCLHRMSVEQVLESVLDSS